jgi:hypothetical protein
LYLHEFGFWSQSIQEGSRCTVAVHVYTPTERE